jgi:hypothetical protein
VVGPSRMYGRQRDALLARAKLALNMLFYEDGIFPSLRVAHLVANRVPVISESCREDWSFVPRSTFSTIVDNVVAMFDGDPLYERAEHAYECLKARPMVLPS